MIDQRPAPTLAQSAARGTVITIVGQFLRIGTQFASIAILARLLDPVDYGYLAMVLAVIGVAELLRDFGLSAAAVQSRDLTQGQQSNLFWLNTAIGGAASLLVLASSPLLAWLYGEPTIMTITMYLSPLFLLNGIAAQFRAHINRNLRFVALAVNDVVPQVVAFGVAIAVAFTTRNYWALVAQQATVAVVSLVLAVALSRWRPSGPRKGESLRSQVRFGMNLFTTHLLTYGVNSAQTVMMGAVWGPFVVGLFSRAYQLMSLPLTQVVSPLTKVALPVLSQVAHDPPRYTSIVRRAQLVGLYLTAPLFLLCFTLAEPMIRVALGSQWSASAPIFAVLALGGAFRAMAQLAFWIFLSSGNTRAQMRFNLATYPVLIVLMLAGLPWQGLGVALGHTVGYALYWPLSLWFACRVAGLPFRPLIGTAGRVFGLVGVGVVAISAAMTHTGLPDLAVLGLAVAGCGLYVAALVAVVPACRRDFTILAAFARGVRR